MKENHYLVPAQLEGQEKDISHALSAKTMEDAEDWFVDAKERLLAINNWQKFSGIANVEFKLTDSRGKAVNRSARKGDHIRIDTDGRGSQFDGGFDWATIEAIEYDDYPDVNMETFAIRVRPSINPLSNITDYAPFLPDTEATSTFVIERVGKQLSAHYHGRNEEGDLVPMSIGKYQAADMAMCAWLGLSDVQCAALVKGLIV